MSGNTTPAAAENVPDWLKPNNPEPEWLRQIGDAEYPGVTFNAAQTRMLLRLLPYLYKVPTVIGVVKELRDQHVQLHGHVKQAADGLATLAAAVQAVAPELEAMRVAVGQQCAQEGDFVGMERKINALEAMIDDLSNSVNERIADLAVGVKPKPPRPRTKKATNPSDVQPSDVPTSEPDVPPDDAFCTEPAVPTAATVTTPPVASVPVPVAAPVPVVVPVAAPLPADAPSPVVVPTAVPAGVPAAVPVAAVGVLTGTIVVPPSVPAPVTPAPEQPAMSALDAIVAQLDELEKPN